MTCTTSKSFFNQQISIENYNKLPPHFQEYSRRILDMGQQVHFVVQQNQEGFGHAVYTRARSGWRRAVPADAGRPYLPLELAMSPAPSKCWKLTSGMEPVWSV